MTVLPDLAKKTSTAILYGICAVLVAVIGAAVRGDWLIILVHFYKQQNQADNENRTLSEVSNTLFSHLGDVHFYIAVSIAGSCLSYFGFAGFLQWYFYINQRHQPEKWKCQPNRFLTKENERHEILLGSSCLLSGAVVSGIIACHIVNGGYTSLYFQPLERGYLWLILSTVGTFIIIDALSFYLHKMFHVPWFYRNFHKWHHRYNAPTAFSATALHPFEFFTLQSVIALPIFIVPMYSGAYIFVLLYSYYYGMVDHSGIKMDAFWPWQPSSMFHDDHHRYFHCNFGFNTILWDWLHDTLRLENRTYDETTFGGKGKQKCS